MNIPPAIRLILREPDVPMPSTELPVIYSDSEYPKFQGSDTKY